jgi:hypothetical protein
MVAGEIQSVEKYLAGPWNLPTTEVAGKGKRRSGALAPAEAA